MFICNHCPYVQAVLDDIIKDARELQPLGIATVAIKAVARAYDAACTPDFFGFNGALELQYRGRIYPVRNRQRLPGSPRELYDAMAAIARSGKGPAEQ